MNNQPNRNENRNNEYMMESIVLLLLYHLSRLQPTRFEIRFINEADVARLHHLTKSFHKQANIYKFIYDFKCNDIMDFYSDPCLFSQHCLMLQEVQNKKKANVILITHPSLLFHLKTNIMNILHTNPLYTT